MTQHLLNWLRSIFYSRNPPPLRREGWGALGLIFCSEMHYGQMRQTSPTKMNKEILIDLRVLAALVSMLARETLSIESPFRKKLSFLTRKLCCVRSRIRPMQNLNLIVISVAVAHEYAQFTNHCTRRKGNVKAQTTNPKMLKMKRQHEKLKLSKYHRARHVF